MSAGTCSCAERTFEAVVFTCPVCVGKVREHLRTLTKVPPIVRLDRDGSVSGLELELESLG